MLQHALTVLDFPVRELQAAKRGFNRRVYLAQARLRWRQIRENTRRPAFFRLPKRLKAHNLARP
jgi:hypothetical protein